MRGILFGLIVALLCNLSGVAQNNVVMGEYIVMLDHVKSEIPLKKALTEIPGCRFKKLGDAPVYKITSKIQDKHIAKQLLNQLKVLPFVVMAQENHIISQRGTVPNDASYMSQWQYNNSGQNGGIVGVDLDAELAWDVTTGGVTPNGDTIVIAILDDGFQLDHPDLKENFWVNSSEIPDNGIDDDNNGYVDDYYGWNPVNNSDNVGVDSHGTAVAGIIGAKGNNGIGVAGVNWNVKMMLLKSSGTEDIVVQSYLYALKARKLYNQTNGAKGAYVVATNASFGLNNTFANETPIWCAMYDSLGRVGIISAGATANNNVNVDVTGDVPTTCPSPYLIAVTNVKSNDEKEFQAGYGVEHIDIGAFGSGVYTTTNNNNYSAFGGTSGATPHVAGAVGLLYAAPSSILADLANNDPANATLLTKQLIITGSEDNANLQNITVSGKRLNLNGVIQEYLSLDTNTCFTSINVNTTTNGAGEMLFSWENLADSSYFYFSINNGLSYDSVITKKSYVLQNLPLCSDVKWYVRAVCENGLSTASVISEVKSAGCCLPPAQLYVDTILENEFQLSWDSVFAFQEFQVRYKFSGQNIWLDSIISAQNYLAVSGLDSCTNYDVEVKTICAIDSTSTPSEIIEVRTIDCATCYQDYCLVGGDTEYEWIDEFTIDGTTNSSGNNNGYAHFGALGAIDLARQATVNLSYVIGASFTSSNERIQVYIDYNQNLQFENNELVYTRIGSSGVTENGSFIVDSSAVLGSTRMRVQLQWNNNVNACSNVAYGEIEDYCINIKPSTVGISENQLVNFNVYPNPANEVLFINGVSKVNNFSIFNSVGKQVKIGSIKQVIDISDLPNGVYLIQIENSVKRFIKQ